MKGCVACVYCSETKHLRIPMLFSSNNYLNFPAFSAISCYVAVTSSNRASLKGKPSICEFICSYKSQHRGSAKLGFDCLEMQKLAYDASLPAVGVPAPWCPTSLGQAAAEGAVPVLTVLPALGTCPL